MNSKKICHVGIILILSVSMLFPIKSFADWAYAFVVWDGYVYVVTDEQVKGIDKEIGHVTKYSDREGTYSGNFSNTYPKGTKYYSIRGVSTEEVIAIQEKDGTYSKATRDGKYAGDKYGLSAPVFLGTIILVIILAIIGINYYGKKRMKKGEGAR